MKKDACLFLLIAVFISVSHRGYGQARVLDGGWHHIRNTGAQEWAEFPQKARSSNLVVTFSARKDSSETTLSMRQRDVKLTWSVKLNGKIIGNLAEDEKDLQHYLKIPARALMEANTLEISCGAAQADDIMLGEISLHDQPLDSLLSQTRVAVRIFEEETDKPLPAKITIVNGRGILQTVSAPEGGPVTTRPGYAYTGSGEIVLGLPAGRYKMYATRGPEYGVDSTSIDLKAGDLNNKDFHIRREVSTAGWAGSDTHIHTFTWSRHGDASAAERAITIAGEGIELPIMTDHNLHVDLKPFAIGQKVGGYFTSVVGNEVTTPVGHFNLFPVSPDQDPADHRADNWKALQQRMRSPGKPQAIILNHARDVHINFRPFDPRVHLSPAGARLDKQEFFPNGMEVINSGSQQSDQFELMRDWFGMLNHGYAITPVGSSDSHDVSRYIVGQARTYIRCNDEDPANIDVQEAVKNFIDGNVTVSFGLFTTIEVNDAYGPGELAPASDEVKIAVSVAGPAWLHAKTVSLYANGKKIREADIVTGDAAGIKWSGNWNLTMPQQDIYLVAVAEGPGKEIPFWPIAKPYQPVSVHWDPSVFGLTGAVWLDGDRNGKRNSAHDYAEMLLGQAGNDVSALVQSLSAYDQSVAVQAAALLHIRGKNLTAPDITRALRKGTPATVAGFKSVLNALPQSTDQGK